MSAGAPRSVRHASKVRSCLPIATAGSVASAVVGVAGDAVAGMVAGVVAGAVGGGFGVWSVCTE